MIKVIWKYKLENIGRQAISMPEGAKILTAEFVDGSAQLWAEVDPDAKRIDKFFQVIPTGCTYNNEGLIYIKTVISVVGFVYHIFREL